MVTPGYNEKLSDLLNGHQINDKTRIILSLNRYERKKNINLALYTFAEYLTTFKPTNPPLLVIAGGYD